MRSNATALKVLLACTIFATVLLLPVLYEAAVFKIDKMRMVPLLEGTEELAASGRWFLLEFFKNIIKSRD